MVMKGFTAVMCHRRFF